MMGAYRFSIHWPSAGAGKESVMAISDNAQLYYLRGNTRLERGDHAGAIADYSAALELDSGRADVCKKRGQTRLEVGDGAGALADFDAVLRIDPQDAAAYRGRSAARLLRGDVAGAEADASAALALRPCAESHAQCGAVRQCSQDFAGAAAEYSRAIESNPRLFWAHLMRGNAYYHMGTLGQTYTDYRRAFELDPRLAASHIVKIVLREISASPAAALAACDEHLWRNPDDFLTYGRRGLILLLLGRDAEAQVDLDAFRSRSPHDAELFQFVIDAALRRRQKPRRVDQAAAQGNTEDCRDEVFARMATGALQL
jgi:tetratricopeptide (TPR) repeat protein